MLNDVTRRLDAYASTKWTQRGSPRKQTRGSGAAVLLFSNAENAEQFYEISPAQAQLCGRLGLVPASLVQCSFDDGLLEFLDLGVVLAGHYWRDER